MMLLGDKADDLTRYQAKAEEDAEREAHEKQESRARATESQTITQLRGEVTALRVHVAESEQNFIEIAENLVQGLDKIENWVRKTVEERVLRSEAEMIGRISERFGERLDFSDRPGTGASKER
jgi:hypothetical protein